MDALDYWDIYLQSFPEDERRTYLQHNKIRNNYKFHDNIIKDCENKTIGFMTYWELSNYIYIEHFAIDKKYRGKGFGSNYLKHFIKTHKNNKIILEVEPPQNDMSKKRVKFYNNLNFKFNDFVYFQPPYKINDNKIQLFIMSYKNKLTKDEFDYIKRKLYTEVYGVEDRKVDLK